MDADNGFTDMSPQFRDFDSNDSQGTPHANPFYIYRPERPSQMCYPMITQQVDYGQYESPLNVNELLVASPDGRAAATEKVGTWLNCLGPDMPEPLESQSESPTQSQRLTMLVKAIEMIKSREDHQLTAPAGPSGGNNTMTPHKPVGGSPHFLDLHPELKDAAAIVFKQKSHIRSFKSMIAHGVDGLEEAFHGALDLVRKLNPDYFSMSYGTRVINIKTDDVGNVHKAIQFGRWSTHGKVSERVMAIYEDQQSRDEKILFLVAVNGSKAFCALAEMIGPWDRKQNLSGWIGTGDGSIPVKWIFVKNVSYGHFTQVKQDRNDQPVINMWNGMTIDWDTGRKAVETYAEAVHFTNVLCWPRASTSVATVHATTSKERTSMRSAILPKNISQNNLSNSGIPKATSSQNIRKAAVEDDKSMFQEKRLPSKMSSSSSSSFDNSTKAQSHALISDNGPSSSFAQTSPTHPGTGHHDEANSRKPPIDWSKLAASTVFDGRKGLYVRPPKDDSLDPFLDHNTHPNKPSLALRFVTRTHKKQQEHSDFATNLDYLHVHDVATSESSYPSMMRETDSMAGFVPSHQQNLKMVKSPPAEYHRNVHSGSRIVSHMTPEWDREDTTPTAMRYHEHPSVQSRYQEAEYLRALADRIELDAKIEAYQQQGFNAGALQNRFNQPPSVQISDYGSPSIVSGHSFQSAAAFYRPNGMRPPNPHQFSSLRGVPANFHAMNGHAYDHGQAHQAVGYAHHVPAPDESTSSSSSMAPFGTYVHRRSQ